MNKEEFAAFFDEQLVKMRAICVAKNKDYTGPKTTSPFENFTRVEMLGIASTEQGFLTRMTDKVSRVISFMQAGQLEVKDESVTDSLLDLANYSILLAGYIESKRRAALPSSGQVLTIANPRAPKKAAKRASRAKARKVA